MPHPPGHNGLADRIDMLERRITELTRRSGGPSSTLGSVTLDEPATSMRVGRIPADFYTLHLDLAVGSSHSSGTVLVQLHTNDSSSGGYDFQYTRHAGSSTLDGRWNDVGYVEVAVAGPGTTWPISAFSQVTIANYATADRTFINAHCGYVAAVGDFRTWLVSGWNWRDRAPVTTVNLTLANGGTFTAGSSLRVYGLR